MNDAHLSARVTIDLSALKANWKTLAALAPKAETGAAIKGEAYGLGAAACGRALWEAGCRSFFVARPKEGEELRAVLPEATIYVLDGLYAGEAGYYLQHRLTPALISFEEAQEWARDGQGAACCIHVDSGINRLSFSATEIAKLVAAKLPLHITLVLSHLASSEEFDNPFNETQRVRFEAVRKLFPGVRASFANSSGVFHSEAFTLDLTRPGIALYGGNPKPGQPNPMKPVATLEARVLQVRDMGKGEVIGYNTTWTAPRDSRIALIGAGYRDGIPRRMSSMYGTSCVFVGGKRCPIVGRVSMDMTAIDVTDAPVKRGDYAEFFGHNISLDEAAGFAGTISWELLTHLGSRYARHYLT
ncbi:alanine racemase [Aestuariivirga litoralis]|uniref:alanine racemase n=1 Tax=Aestuariivirga litoralis TaxID=2650924 RepID=UPI0018C7FEDB|nr:alanine racemase [Aestuariivirga litoralis]MBG1231109.1 alanine racemase [Aestuariivirga litoralis]